MLEENKKSDVIKLIQYSVLAFFETLALFVNHFAPIPDDAMIAASNLISTSSIEGLNPWMGEMNGALHLIGNLACNFTDFGFYVPILLILLICAHMWSDSNKCRYFSRKYEIGKIVIAVIFGMIQTMGMSIHESRRLYFCYANIYQILLFSICVIGTAGLYVLTVNTVEYILNNKKSLLIESDNMILSKTEINKKELYIYAGIIFIAYFIWILCFLPGSVDFDSHYSMIEYFTTGSTQHFPMFTNWLRAWTLLIGRRLGSDNAGVLVYIIMQLIALVYAFEKVIRFEMYLSIRRGWRVATTLFYAFVPVFGDFAESMVKNTLFTAVFTCFVCNMIEIIISSEDEQNKNIVIKFAISGVLSCLLLKTGAYVVIISMLILSVYKFRKNGDRRSLYSFISVIVCFSIFSILCTNILRIPKTMEGADGEMYSLPSIVTAYYLKENADNISNEEKILIENVFTCSIDDIKEGYVNGNADWVKRYWDGDAQKSDILKYFSYWIITGFKHPRIYMEGILNQIYGYYTLAQTDRIKNGDKEAYYDYYVNIGDGGYDISYMLNNQPVRDSLTGVTHFFERNPWTGWMTNQGLCTWVLISMMFMTIGTGRNKRFGIILGCMLLYVLTCIAAPINGLLRYYLPVIACMPVMWSAFARLNVSG